MTTQLQTLPTTLPLSLTAPYRCHVTQSEWGIDWEPVDEYSAIPVENLVSFAEDYEDSQAVALILAALRLEVSEQAYDEVVEELDTETLECPFATIGYLQAAGYVTLDTEAA